MDTYQEADNEVEDIRNGFAAAHEFKRDGVFGKLATTNTGSSNTGARESASTGKKGRSRERLEILDRTVTILCKISPQTAHEARMMKSIMVII